MGVDFHDIHLRDIKRERIFAEKPDGEEMPSIHPVANDHEVNGPSSSPSTRSKVVCSLF